MEAITNPPKNVALDVNGMQLNKAIYIHGVTHDNSQGRYFVNLVCGSNPDYAEIALHVNPRFDTQEIVRNDYRHDSWGEEEKDGGFPHPSHGYPFNLWITCRENYFEVQFQDDEIFKTFYHRRPYYDVTNIVLGGDCDFKTLWATIEQQSLKTILRPSLPFDQEVPFQDGMGGHSVTIRGIPTTDYGRMEFNLIDSEGNYHLHCNPRMQEQVVVRNHYDVATGHFVVEKEENDLDIAFPFARNVPFMIKMTEDGYGFRVEINGGKAFHFRHRRDNYNDVNRFMMSGDMIVKKIEFH